MLTLLGRRRRLCNGLSRRQLLQVGGAGLFGLQAAQLEAFENVQPVTAPRARSVLFVYLFGGPSQLETFDMKPDAASHIRGPFQSIAA